MEGFYSSLRITNSEFRVAAVLYVCVIGKIAYDTWQENKKIKRLREQTRLIKETPIDEREVKEARARFYAAGGFAPPSKQVENWKVV